MALIIERADNTPAEWRELEGSKDYTGISLTYWVALCSCYDARLYLALDKASLTLFLGPSMYSIKGTKDKMSYNQPICFFESVY